jgi:hypothetical protein
VDPQAPASTIGGLASETVVADGTVYGAPPGHHILDDIGFTPGEIVQLCRDNPSYPLCT